MSTGRMVSYKRLAVHDGPGIRTTLFLKGCSLHCRWCHNPECVSPEPELACFAAKCIGCGRCAKVCSCHRIEGGIHHFERRTCRACGRCAAECPREALIFYGRSVTASEAAEKLAEDLPFYEQSGGGATLSGGEPLLQPEFCREVFQLLWERGIHTALDTCGNVPYERFELVLPWTKLVLYDLKAMSSSLHRELTGAGNERILDNLARLAATAVPLEIRMPLAAGLNDAPEELHRAGEFLSRLPRPVLVRLLACHNYAQSKYEALGRRFSAIEDSPLDSACAILQRYSLEIVGQRIDNRIKPSGPARRREAICRGRAETEPGAAVADGETPTYQKEKEWENHRSSL